ncbi:MAG: LysR family transcriptional regulator [Burkholderiales bacterium]|nr:LysR family transcriptional regulator [Burkholderiales bacterium]
MRQLRAFGVIAVHGSFSRAAAVLGLDASALSRQVATLERELGVRLFHRTGRGAPLTELGERLAPLARALLDDMAAFAEAARGERGRPSGQVALGVVPVAARGLVAKLAGYLRRDYPGIRLRAFEGYSGAVEEWLAAGRVDIGLFNRYRSGRVRDAEPLLHADVYLIGARGNPALRAEQIPLRALQDVPLALPASPNSMASLLTTLAMQQHFDLNIALEAGSTSLIADAIAGSELCTISPCPPFSRELASGEFAAARLVRPVLQQTTWMALSSAHPLPRAAQVVARAIRELARRE